MAKTTETRATAVPTTADAPAAPAGAAAKSGANKSKGRSPAIGPLAVELRIAIMRTSRRLRSEATTRDISPGQYSVLAGISKDSLSVGQLAERELIQAPSMTRIVNGLEAHGFVERVGHPTDKRQVMVQITDAGTAALATARSKRTEWLAKRVAQLKPEERTILRDAARILQEMSAQ